MSRKKGLSADEKAVRLKELFHESSISPSINQSDVFTLKQLEPMAYKQKGIVSQSVKEILSLLVADNLVQQDKIGVGTYFWSFPSAHANNLKNKVGDLTTNIETLKTTRESLKNDIVGAKRSREPSDERTAKLAKIEELEKARDLLKQELRKYADMDPEIVETMEYDAKVATDAANRWTDNIWQLKRFCTSKGMAAAEFHSAFGIDPDLESL